MVNYSKNFFHISSFLHFFDTCYKLNWIYARYYRREGSIVRSTFTEKRYDFFEAVAKNEEVIKREYIQSPELKQALQAKKLLGGFVVIGAKADSGLKDFSKDRELLRVEMSDLLKNNKLSWKLKLKYLIFMLNPRLYLLLR